METTTFKLSVRPGPRGIGGKILKSEPAMDGRLIEAFSNPELDPPSSLARPVHFSLRGYPELAQEPGSTDLGYYKLDLHIDDCALLDHGARILGAAGHNVTYA